MTAPAARPSVSPPSAERALVTEDELVVTGEAVMLEVRPAGFLLRAASAIIDWIVLCIVTAVLAAVGTLALTGMRAVIDMALGQALLIGFVVFCLVIMPMLIEWLSRGKSLGRLIMGVRIVRDDGGAITLRHAFIRALAGVLDFAVTQGALAAITGMLNARSKRVGDILAGTYAQYERVPQLNLDMGPLPAGMEGWANIADVARIPDWHARRVRDYLLQAPYLDAPMRERVATDLARQLRVYVHPLPDVEADVFLRAVAVVRRDREIRAHHLRAARLARIEPQLRALPHGFPQRG